MEKKKSGTASKIVKGILIFIAANIVIDMIITPIIYNMSFKRYDPETSVSASQIDIEEFADLTAGRQNYNFESGKNTLNSYFYDSATDEDKALIVFAPGMHSTSDDYLPQIKTFTENGYGVFIFDPTGSYLSEGKSEKGFEQELIDLGYALDFCRANDNFGFDKVALFGHSRGGYSVCNIENFGYDVDAIVSVSGIDSAMDAIMEPVADSVGDIAYINYPMLALYQLVLFGPDYVMVEAHETLEEVDTPALIIHGAQDEKISLTEYSVYSYADELADDEETEFMLSEGENGSGHSDMLFEYEDEENIELMNTVIVFLDENL